MFLDVGASFNTNKHGMWIRHYWWVAVILSMVYVAATMAGKNVMANRQPLSLRRTLVAWSSGLAIFSFVGTIMMARAFWHVVLEAGWHGSVCSEAGVYNGEAGLWLWLFVLSKILVLGDTVFMVLHKQRMPFLHWYHHATALVCTWFLYSRSVALLRYFALLNYAVNFMMYLYYALSAAGLLHRPRRLKIAITGSQMANYVISLCATFYASQELLAGNLCDADPASIAIATLMNCSYLCLITRLFYDMYIKSSHKLKT